MRKFLGLLEIALVVLAPPAAAVVAALIAGAIF